MRSVVALYIAMACSVAHADPNDDRTELIARIEDAVHAIAASLQTPTPHMFQDAAKHGNELRDLVARLAPVKGDDEHAANIVAHYPGYADAVDAGLAKLEHLGQQAHLADGVADRCAKDDAALHALIKKRSDHPDPDPMRDVDALAAKAAAYGTTWSATLAVLATVDASVTSDVTATQLALTDGYWMAIASNLATIARASAATWTEHYAAATTACEQLARGVDHADLAARLASLRARDAAMRTAATQVVHDYNAWLASVRDLRDLALKNRDGIRASLCAATDPALDNVGIAATSLAHELAIEVAAVQDEATRLTARSRDNPARARAIADGVRSNAAIVAAISRDDARGRQNPRLVAVLGAISQRRDHALAAFGCVSRSVDVAPNDCGGAACRIACIKLVDHTCTLAEPVPDTDAGKAAGLVRSQHELAGLAAWYRRDQADVVSKAPVLRRCEIATPPSLDLFADVVGYETCARADELGDALPAVTADIEP